MSSILFFFFGLWGWYKWWVWIWSRSTAQWKTQTPATCTVTTLKFAIQGYFFHSPTKKCMHEMLVMQKLQGHNSILHLFSTSIFNSQPWFFLLKAIFINSQSEIYFTLWAFAYCLLQASSDWHWLAVDGVSTVLRSERMGLYVEDNLNCPMSRFILRSCPRWMWTASLIHLVNLLLSLERILLFSHSMVWFSCATWSLIADLLVVISASFLT